MKTKLFTLLLAVAASVGTMFASTQIGDLYYNLDATNQTAEVTSQNSGNYSGDIVIPASVTYASVTYSVTSIGNDAFYNCTGLTSIEIPNSVTSIGEYAFSGTGLTSLVYNAHVFAFMPTTYSGAYTIPDGIESIAGWAFYNCTGLTSVTIPNSVTSIGNRAFSGCTSLTSVTIPNSVTSIGGSAFSGCTGLTSPVYNTHVFAYMPTSYSGAYTIPDGIESIAGWAFYRCSSLTSVMIPNSVTSIGEGAFCGCSGLASPVYNTHVFAYMPTSYTGAYTIPDGIESIAGWAFDNCTGLTSVTIPNSVTSIGNYAFEYCSSLTSVTIPNSVTSIGENAFDCCSGLTSIEIPNSVTGIGNQAFRNCSGLTSVTIPNSVTSIGRSTFYKCTGLTSPVYNTHVFAYMPTSYSGAYTIPDGIESIAGSAFYGCSGLTSVTIPNSVTSIGDDAFRGCSGLTSVTIPNSVTSIGDRVFYECTGLTSVTIPNSVTSIGGGAFYGCSGLTSVTIPNSVTSIGDDAFYGCSGLTSVTIEAKTPPALDYHALGFGFDIYVPCGTLEAYKTAWADYADRIRLGVEYTITGKVDDANAGSVDYPTSSCGDVVITAVPNNGYHFTQWSDGNTDNPRTIELTQDTTFTAEFAIARMGTCGKDLALVWSYDPTNKVLTIGNAGSFTENMQFGLEAPTEMEELVIGNSVTAIGANAFAGIETLKKVSIGEAVKTIGEQAFYNCVNLETIFNYRPTPTNAYSNAFDGVDKFECKLYVLPSSIDMYKNASVWRDFYYNTYAIGAEEATVTTNDVTVEPQDNAATFTWPTSNNVASYTIEITKDGIVFCTLIFNSNGQLTGIAFAPSRDGQAHAPSALMTANGLQFTVTGLNSNTQYGYNLTAKDANDQTVATYSGEFTTTGEGTATGVDNVPSDQVQSTKFLRNGKMYIIRGEKVYNAQGALVK